MVWLNVCAAPQKWLMTRATMRRRRQRSGRSSPAGSDAAVDEGTNERCTEYARIGGVFISFRRRRPRFIVSAGSRRKHARNRTRKWWMKRADRLPARPQIGRRNAQWMTGACLTEHSSSRAFRRDVAWRQIIHNYSNCCVHQYNSSL